MKRTYLTPSMVMVRLQHQSIICQSPQMTSMSQGDTGYGGASSNNTSGEARTRESSGVWDEEW